jgi:hypothetical protein
MFMAKQGWLGPEIGAQSRQIERTMAAGLVGVYQNPQAASSVQFRCVGGYTNVSLAVWSTSWHEHLPGRTNWSEL